jgi:hypothetical protein
VQDDRLEIGRSPQEWVFNATFSPDVGREITTFVEQGMRNLTSYDSETGTTEKEEAERASAELRSFFLGMFEYAQSRRSGVVDVEVVAEWKVQFCPRWPFC